jgi:translocation and assembly module TamB
MESHVARQRFDELDRPSKKTSKRRFRPLKTALMVCLFLLAIVVVFLPQIITNRGLMVGIVNKYGGIAPLKVDIERIDAGWFSSIVASGIQLNDGDGKTIMKIGRVQTQKGLFGWMMNRSNLGTVRVANLEADIETFNGTSDLELALAPLMGGGPTSTPQGSASSPSSRMLGAIEIVDTRLDLSSRGNPQHWTLSVPQLSVVLPRESEVIGPVKLQATLASNLGPTAPPTISGALAAIPASANDRSGTIVAEVQQTAGQASFELRALIDHIPLEFWHVVHARLPDLPIDAVQGSVSAKLAGILTDANRWNVDVQQFQTSQLAIAAPQLIGPNPARLNQVAGVGRCTMADAKLTLEGSQLACDFGNVTAQAQIPWPIATPTLTQPWLPGATIDARGTVDLAQLVKTADTLIPMRQDTQLISGTAQFVVSQQNDATGNPISAVSFELANLKAVASGQTLNWNDPLKLQLQAGAGADRKVQFGALCAAEFCNLQGQGTLESGNFNGEANLDLLQQRISQFVDLPVHQMTGSANIQIKWIQTQLGLVETTGSLSTTPLLIASKTGGELREPAWKGSFQAATVLENNSPTQLNSVQLDMTSDQERVIVSLTEPLRLVATPAGAHRLPPAKFNIQLNGDLAKWQQRGMAFGALPSDMAMGGNVNLGVEGRVDLNHAEVTQANWKMQPFQLLMSQVQVAEPQMVGTFKGRVDTSDLARLVVEKLEVQATSFSLGAADAASQDGKGRVGQAAFLVDVGNLMNSVQGTATKPNMVQPSKAAAATHIGATGRVQGTLAWQVNAVGAAFKLDSVGENIVVDNRNAAGTKQSNLWAEPQIKAGLTGKYEMATGALDLENVRAEAPWLNYVGNMSYKTVGTEQTIVMKGQAVYDAGQVGQRIQPWTGGQVQLGGQKTVPIDVVWKGKSDSVGSSLAGLQAATRLGWEQARVVGITNGQLTTNAEIPVSGGVVRWDVASDLTASEMIVYQKPMVVLENVAITPEMCQSWLKYVTPLIAEATSVEGRLSLKLDQATLNPSNPRNQTVVGQLLIHSAEVGPGPLSNQIIQLVQQVQAVRKGDFTQAVGNQKIWLKMPEQKVDFEMVEGKVIHRNLSINAGDVMLSTSGWVGIDGQMALVASMPIPDDWVQKSPLLASMRGQSLQFPIQGPLTGPRLDTQMLRQFGRQQLQQAASGAIQQQLSKGLEKLFGAPPPQQPPVQGNTGQ